MMIGIEYEMPNCGRVWLLFGERLKYSAVQEMVSLRLRQYVGRKSLDIGPICWGYLGWYLFRYIYAKHILSKAWY